MFLLSYSLKQIHTYGYCTQSCHCTSYNRVAQPYRAIDSFESITNFAQPLPNFLMKNANKGVQLITVLLK